VKARHPDGGDCDLALAPTLFMILTSVKSPGGIYLQTRSGLPQRVVLDHFPTTVLFESAFHRLDGEQHHPRV
jgi:hypothetical protein